MGALTEKDHADLLAGLAADADWIALSFVQRPEDIIDVRKIVQGRAGVMAKIEKPQAVERLEEIIKLCDAFMIARGDLGVEMPLEQVPGLQKRMIRIARRYGKPVVVATQMLESMITSPVPTRAEVSDVSIAVFEGADAIMLSAESASGQYPIEAVSMMNKVADRGRKRRQLSRHHPRPGHRARSHRRRRHLGRHPPGRRDPRSGRHRHLHLVGLDRHPRRPRAAEQAHPRALAQPRAPYAACRSSGASIAWRPRTR